jgi:hypothetical protein
VAFYQVEGTSVIGWSLLVEASSGSEAGELALRVARGLGQPEQHHVQCAVHHQIVRSRRVRETPGEDETDHRLAVQIGHD